MNLGQAVSTDKPRQRLPVDRARFFYTGGAAVLLVLTFLGFQQFYLHGRAFPNRPLAPPQFQLWGLNAKQFLTVPVISITIFAGFVAIAIWKRAKPEVHKPMMLLATLAAVPAALDRIPWMSDVYGHTIFGAIFGPFFSGLVIAGILLLLHRALTGKLNKYFVAGWLVLVVTTAGIMKLATTQA